MGTWACLEAQPLLSHRAPLAETTCLLGVPHAPGRVMWPKSSLHMVPPERPARSFPKPETSLPKRVRMGGACLPC